MAPRKDGQPKKKPVYLPHGKKHVALDYKEIGEIMGCSHVRAMQIHKRALRKIREEITRLAAEAGMTPREWLFGSTDE